MAQQGIGRRRFLQGTAAAGMAAVAGLAPVRARAQSSPTKVTFGWPFANGAQGMMDLAQRFQEKKKSIEVEVQVIPQTQVIPKLTTAFTGGSAPDCMGMSDAWLSQFARGGWLASLEPYLSASGIEKDILPGMMTIARMYNNTAYNIGYQTEAYSLFYNKKLFAEAGLSAPANDVDEFRKQAIKLTDVSRNRFGYYVLGGSGWQFQQWSDWMVNHGGLGVDQTLYGADGKCILAGDKFVEGLTKWVNLYQKDKVSPPASATGTFQDQSNAFNAGQVGMVLGWGAYLTTLAKAVGEDTLGTAKPPAGPAGQFYYYGGNGFSINDASKNKDAAWEFITFVLEPKNISEWNRQYGAIPANIRSWDDEWLQAPKYKAPLEMLKSTKQLISNPRNYPGYASFQLQTAPEEIQKTLLGRQTPKEHATAIAAALDALRAKAEQK